MPQLAAQARDDLWVECARAIGLPVARGGDAYVHFDGETLHIAGDEHLDDDDTLAQLVLHELCHLAVQGPAFRFAPDWGLDNTTSHDEYNERAAVRLQAHVTGFFGLRALLHPTTVVRPFYESLPDDAFFGDASQDPSIALARAGAARLGQSTKLGDAVASALARTRALMSRPPARTVDPEPDCLTCGACCRGAYDAVLLDPSLALDRGFAHRHPALVVVDGAATLIRRDAAEDNRCAALRGPAGGPFRCVAYEDRPSTCRDFERGSENCFIARRRVGLSFEVAADV